MFNDVDYVLTRHSDDVKHYYAIWRLHIGYARNKKREKLYEDFIPKLEKGLWRIKSIYDKCQPKKSCVGRWESTIFFNVSTQSFNHRKGVVGQSFMH